MLPKQQHMHHQQPSNGSAPTHTQNPTHKSGFPLTGKTNSRPTSNHNNVNKHNNQRGQTTTSHMSPPEYPPAVVYHHSLGIPKLPNSDTPTHDSATAISVRQFCDRAILITPVMQMSNVPTIVSGNGSPLHTWEGPIREGHHELLIDYDDDGGMTIERYGNIAALVCIVTPSVPPEFSLASLWEAYDMPYGFELPMHGARISWLRPEEALYYTPVLSGFHLETLSGATYEHYVTMTPPDRLPLPQYMKWLAKTKPRFSEMMSVKGATLTGNSWYCVLWMPIHCQNHPPQRSAGTFLTYHFVNPSSSSEDPAFRGAPFNSTSLATPAKPSLETERRYRFCSMFAILPYRVRADVWYRAQGSGLYRAPLTLVKNVRLVMQHEAKRGPKEWDGHHDFEHYLKYDRGLADFLRMTL